MVALATQPWSERPGSLPLDEDECLVAIELEVGDLDSAASRLKVSHGRLRRFVFNKPRLLEAYRDLNQRYVARAKRVIWDHLHSEDARISGPAARFVLGGRFARDEGFGSVSAAEEAISQPIRQVIVWGDPERLAALRASGQLIEAEPAADDGPPTTQEPPSEPPV